MCDNQKLRFKVSHAVKPCSHLASNLLFLLSADLIFQDVERRVRPGGSGGSCALVPDKELRHCLIVSILFIDQDVG